MFVSAILINHEYLALAWLLSCQRQNGQNGVGLVFHSRHQSVQGEMWRNSSSNSFQRTSISVFMMLTFMDPMLRKHPVNFNRLKTILEWELFVSIWFRNNFMDNYIYSISNRYVSHRKYIITNHSST